MDEMLALFADETSEILGQLNGQLIDLEQDPNNTELINDLFRHAHTLKGMAATLGFKEMAQLTHEMEDLMDKIRSGKDSVSEEKIDILLKCIELLEEMSQDYLNEGGTNVSVDEIVARIRNDKPTQNSNTSNVTQEEKKDSLDSIDEEHLNIELHMDPEIQMPSLRAFIFLNKLKEKGLYINSQPSIDDCKDEEKFNGSIVLQCKGTEISLETLINNEYIFDDFKISKVAAKPKETLDTKENEPSEQAKIAKKKADKSKQSVRIQSEKLDLIINLVAELVIEKNKLELLVNTSGSDEFKDPTAKIDRIINQLQGIVMNVRMIPIASTFKLFPKEIRNTSKALGKKVNLTILGEETELDRGIVDHIKDPLVHIIRNSLDHGLESTEERIAKGKPEEGNMRIVARYEGNQVVIEVSDDGKGIDGNFIAEKAIQKGLITSEQAKNLTMKEKVNLICSPGFSTAEKVTNLSGRGVGLDAVKKFIEDLNGTLEIDTVVGKGTTTRLFLPLTLGIIQSMVVNVGSEKFAIPLSDIETLINKNQAELSISNSNEILIYKEKTYPVVHLSDVVDVPIDKNDEEFAILVKKGSKNYALMVQGIVGQTEIVIKNLGGALKDVKQYSGAAILGDGYVCLILDVAMC